MRAATRRTDDVNYGHASDQERVANQRAVTASRHRFGTHDRRWSIAGEANQFIDGSGELGCLHVVGLPAK